MELDVMPWGSFRGSEVCLFRLTASDGAYVELTNKGATWVSAVLPGADGHCDDLLLGYDTLQGYIDDTCYIGATVGRYANRIARARIVVNGVEYPLEANDGVNTNHGGFDGWNRRVWNWERIPGGVRFSLLSPHLDAGFPGEVHASVDYCWGDDHTMRITHRAVTDRDTCINLTNHAYFNLSGKAADVAGHLLRIGAHLMLDADEEYIPTGTFSRVAHTPFDFTDSRPIGNARAATDPRMVWNRGYNHCYVLGTPGETHLAAVLSHPQSRHRLTVTTTLPAVLLYTAGFLPGNPGKNGVPLLPQTGVCLETQFYPDAPSHEHFPSTLLHPGETYSYTTDYKFDIL